MSWLTLLFSSPLFHQGLAPAVPHMSGVPVRYAATALTIPQVVQANAFNQVASTAQGAAQSSATLSCLQHFFQQQPPVLLKSSLKQHGYPLCNEGFAVYYSGVSKTPLWVAEWLSPQKLAQKVKREDAFQADQRVLAQHRAELEDYRGSGFDRGHMAASGNMGTRLSQNQSFALSNIVPQNRDNNQLLWRDLEEATRAIVTKQKTNVYVLTGSLYEGNKLQRIGQGVLVPTSLYKVLYVPETGVISAYVAPNDASQQVSIMSVCALEQRLGINLLPQMPVQQKRAFYALPLSAKQVKARSAIQQLSSDLQAQCNNAAPPLQQQAREVFNQNIANSSSDIAQDRSQDRSQHHADQSNTAGQQTNPEHEPQQTQNLPNESEAADLNQLKEQWMVALLDWFWQLLRQWILKS